MQKPRAGMAFIFITLLIDVLGFGIVIPVLPKLVAELARGDTANGARFFGLLLASYGVMQFFFSPILGGLSDRYGRRPVLLVSLAFTSLEFFVLANAHSIWILFAGRILTGITGASFTAASAYIADISPPDKRAKNFGIIGAAFGAGFILGPAAGGLLGHFSLRAPFWAAGILSLLNCLYGAFVLPESLPKEDRRRFSMRNANPVAGLAILGRFGWVRLMAVGILLVGLAQQSLQATWVLYTTYRFQWTELDNGLSLSLVGLASGAAQAFLTGLLVRKVGEPRTIMFGMVFSIIGFTGFALATNGWIMAAVILVWSLAGVSGPATQSLISREYGANEQGAAQGALTSLQSLTGVFGPLLATGVFSYFTAKTTPVLIPGAAFFVSALLTALALVVALFAFRNVPARKVSEDR